MDKDKIRRNKLNERKEMITEELKEVIACELGEESELILDGILSLEEENNSLKEEIKNLNNYNPANNPHFKAAQYLRKENEKLNRFVKNILSWIKDTEKEIKGIDETSSYEISPQTKNKRINKAKIETYDWIKKEIGEL